MLTLQHISKYHLKQNKHSRANVKTEPVTVNNHKQQYELNFQAYYYYYYLCYVLHLAGNHFETMMML